MNTRTCISLLKRLSNINNISYKTPTNIRNYSRWAHRRPARVLTPEEYNAQENKRKQIEPEPESELNYESTIKEFKEIDFTNVIKEPVKKPKQKNKSNTDQKDILYDLDSLDEETHFTEKKNKKNKEKENTKKVAYTTQDVQLTTFDEDGNFVYTKIKDNDSKIGTLMLTVKSRKLRDRKDCILLEGKRLIKDALEAGCKIQNLLFSRKSDLEFVRDYLPKKNVQIYKMMYKDLSMWSDLTTCPGIMGIFKTPNIEDIKIKNDFSIPLTIICDNIREPGNLGAILRASVAAGAEKIILTKGCVDLWETKVLRSSCGAHFRSPIYKNLNWDDIPNILPKNKHIFLADNNILTSEKSNTEHDALKEICANVPVLPYFGVNFMDCTSIVLIIGGETMGLSVDSYYLAYENKGIRLNIPLNNNIESLNTGTALGIIAFEIKRQLLLQKK